MKSHAHKAAAAIALFTGLALALAGCATAENDETTRGRKPGRTLAPLCFGTLLPQSGTLARLIDGPQAAVKLAMQEINDAGGVLDQDIELVLEVNEFDSSDPTILNKSVDDIVAARPAFVLGAMSTGNTNAAMPRLSEAQILMGSPSNTGIELSGANKYYFRTIASDIIQGRALGQPRAAGRIHADRDPGAKQRLRQGAARQLPGYCRGRRCRARLRGDGLE